VASARLRRLAPALVVLLVALLAGLSIGSGWVVLRHFRSDATAISRLYAGVFAGLNDPRPGAEAGALLQLGEQVRKVGIPLVVTDSTGRVTASANLPFDVPLDDPRVLSYARRLDRQNPPIVDPSSAPCISDRFRPSASTALVVLQGLILLGIVLVGAVAYRNAMASQRTASGSNGA
jgi:hypothetical protein